VFSLQEDRKQSDLQAMATNAFSTAKSLRAVASLLPEMAATATSVGRDEHKVWKENRPVCEAYTSATVANTNMASAPASTAADAMKVLRDNKDSVHKGWKRAEKGNNNLVCCREGSGKA